MSENQRNISEKPEAEIEPQANQQTEEVAGRSGEEAKSKSRRKTSPLVLIAVVVIAAVAIAAIGAFWRDINNFFYLQAWSPAKPRAAAKAFCQAIVNRDAQALRELLVDPGMMETDDEGRLKAIKPMNLQRARWFDVTRLELSPELADKAPVRYVTSQSGPVAIVAVPMGGGPNLEMLIAVRPEGGKWKVVELRLPGPAVGGRSGGAGEAWKTAVEGKPNPKTPIDAMGHTKRGAKKPKPAADSKKQS